MLDCSLELATKLRASRATFERAQRCGFTAVELWTNAESLRHSGEIGKLAQDFPFSYVIHFPNKPNLQPEDVDGAVTLYRHLQCRAMVVHEPMYRIYGAELLAKQSDLRLGIENHRLDKKQFSTWAERHQWLTLDVEHLWLYTLAGEPLSSLERALRQFLQRYAEKLVHVHLPGCIPGHEEHRPMYCSREMVMMVLTQLCQAGFDGLVVSEVELEYQNVPELTMDVLLFERWQQLHEVRLRKKTRISAPTS
jgi:sugar phosphate isomerase/epimerase